MRKAVVSVLMLTCVGFSQAGDRTTFINNFLNDKQADHAETKTTTGPDGDPLYEVIYHGTAKYQLCSPDTVLCAMPAMMTEQCTD